MRRCTEHTTGSRRAVNPDQAALRRCAWLIASVAHVLVAAPAAGQAASGWLPFDHWSRHALVRLHALGLDTGQDPVRVQQWTDDVDSLLARANGDELAALWRRRLEEERAGRIDPRLSVELTGTYSVREGAVRTGRFTLDRQWIAPAGEPDHADPGGRLHVRLSASELLALTAEVAGHGDAYRLEHGTATTRIGTVRLWAGRRALGFAPGVRGGLVLTQLPRVDGIGAASSAPVRLPVLGTMTAELFVGRVGANGHVREPWALGMRAHVAPHPRFDIGATRIALFGAMGDANLGVRQIIEVLIAANLKPPYADDQVAALDARWRPPLATIPLELYGEWGMHDIDPGVFIDVPAFTIGVRAPALPGARALAATLEHTQISRSCCENPPWYHHFEFADGWTMRGAPLGHPLGGHGREWRMTLAAVSAAGVASVSALLRTRGHENLYAPTRVGRATGFRLSADARVNRHTAIVFDVQTDMGDGWNEVRAIGGVRWSF